MTEVLDLIILNSGSDDGVAAVARSGSDFAMTLLPFGQELKRLTDFRNWIESSVRGSSRTAPTSGQLVSFGEQLYTFTFRDEIRELYSGLPKEDVRLNIFSNRPEIQNLPWEYLQEPK